MNFMLHLFYRKLKKKFFYFLDFFGILGRFLLELSRSQNFAWWAGHCSVPVQHILFDDENNDNDENEDDDDNEQNEED